MASNATSEFERAVSTQRSGGVLSDFWYFLKTSKKWWLIPLIVILVGFGALMLLGGTAAAPFIYTLF